MITGIHTMFYSSEATALREFLRDTLGFQATDIGDGWLIFQMPPTEMGVHPSDAEKGSPSGLADISFICDDIHQTVAELKTKGVVFSADVADHGYGFVTYMRAPGNFLIQLYQPKYKV